MHKKHRDDSVLGIKVSICENQPEGLFTDPSLVHIFRPLQ